MLVLPFSERAIEKALGAGPALVAMARAERVPVFAASLVQGPAVLLGCHQRAERVLDGAACRAAGVRVLRRTTSGTAAFVGRRALVLSLALPGVAALFPDASPRTLLNRNVRPFLRGLSAAGAPAHYFGREWVSARKRPAALFAFDAAEDGPVLVEAIFGLDEPFAIPERLASPDERAVARFGEHAPAALAEVLPAGTPPERVARCVIDAIAARASSAVVHVADDLPATSTGATDRRAADVGAPDPLPQEGIWLPPARIPIGWLERACLRDPAAPRSARLWLAGDVLASRALLDRVAALADSGSGSSGDLASHALEGVSLEDLFEAAAQARKQCEDMIEYN